ncbi:3961_t:CDS:2 [Entrophospora sp. SA101]|nr:3958_t:CDS:2 [Entrophospora sp. SA101]CAJ0926668.1 3961_t:CDS:2 [Entrophospora sp. SA101]
MLSIAQLDIVNVTTMIVAVKQAIIAVRIPLEGVVQMDHLVLLMNIHAHTIDIVEKEDSFKTKSPLVNNSESPPPPLDMDGTKQRPNKTNFQKEKHKRKIAESVKTIIECLGKGQ